MSRGDILTLLLALLVIAGISLARSWGAQWIAAIAGPAAFFVLVGLTTVPQDERWVVELLGRYDRVLQPGLRFLIPAIETVKRRVSIREQILSLDVEKTLTKDGILVTIKSVLYYRLSEDDPQQKEARQRSPFRATYAFEAEATDKGADWEKAFRALGASTLRSVLGDRNFDEAINDQPGINKEVEGQTRSATEPWGYFITRHVITEFIPPDDMREALEKKVRAEKERDAMIAEAEGRKQAEMKAADAKKYALIAEAEAKKAQQQLDAEGEALGIKLRGEVLRTPEGAAAAEYNLQEQRIDALKRIADEATTLVVTPELSNVVGLGVAGKKLFDIAARKSE